MNKNDKKRISMNQNPLPRIVGCSSILLRGRGRTPVIHNVLACICHSVFTDRVIMDEVSRALLFVNDLNKWVNMMFIWNRTNTHTRTTTTTHIWMDDLNVRCQWEWKWSKQNFISNVFPFFSRLFRFSTKQRSNAGLNTKWITVVV